MARTQRVFRTTLLVTAVIILSKVFGFVRDMILANYFGTGMENDAYVSAYSLFYLPDKDRTMAELPPEEKNLLSHRYHAMSRAAAFLRRIGE